MIVGLTNVLAVALKVLGHAALNSARGLVTSDTGDNFLIVGLTNVLAVLLQKYKY